MRSTAQNLFAFWIRIEMKVYTSQQVGCQGERVAAKFLKRAGYHILARNKHFGRNELDLVATDKQYIVFVEVKACSVTETDVIHRRPAEAVDRKKRLRTVKAAIAYLNQNKTALCPRFDVIEVYLDRKKRLCPVRVNHIIDAFSSNGNIRR
ncbi:MAG: YraN family protein [Clostridia bacterium]|nr:YraN family protein [Clostridia bacterium]